MLKRTETSQRVDRDWFFFASGLMHGLCSDYIAVRLLYMMEPLTTGMTILPKMLDVVEKSLKVHLFVHTQSETALTDAQSDYGHNIEKLRAACSKFNAEFDHQDIRALTRDLNDKRGQLYQYLRYGSQATTAGFEGNIGLLLPVVDRVFSESLLLLPDHHRRVLLFCSSLKSLMTRSRFDQSRNPEQLLQALAHNNPYFIQFQLLFRQLDEEHQLLVDQFNAAGT